MAPCSRSQAQLSHSRSVFLLAAHCWLHTPFPQEGALYLIPLTVLPVTAAILKGKNKAAQIAFLWLSALLLARYLSEFPIGAYAAGSQFAGGRTVAKTLRAKAGLGSARIGVSLAAEPIMNYYRTRYRQGNWQHRRASRSPEPTITTSLPLPTPH